MTSEILKSCSKANFARLDLCVLCVYRFAKIRKGCLAGERVSKSDIGGLCRFQKIPQGKGMVRISSSSVEINCLISSLICPGKEGRERSQVSSRLTSSLPSSIPASVIDIPQFSFGATFHHSYLPSLPTKTSALLLRWVPWGSNRPVKIDVCLLSPGLSPRMSNIVRSIASCNQDTICRIGWQLECDRMAREGVGRRREVRAQIHRSVQVAGGLGSQQ